MFFSIKILWNQKKISFLGMMGSGKTSIGKLTSKKQIRFL